jgi:apolipoprotein N-acyltransferase
MIRVTLLSRTWRLATALLVTASFVTLPTYVLALFLLPPVPPIVMVRSFLVGTALPAVVAWALGRAFGGGAEVTGGVLGLRRGDLDVEVPCAAIVAIRPWWVSLPRPGLSVRLAGGGRPPVDPALDDPRALREALAAGGVDVAAARRHPSVIHAATRRGHRWRRALLKFPLFGALPAGLLFYTHQHIAYGGTFGQYYLEGPAAWARTLAEYWAVTVILLLSYASLWRAGAEAAVWIAAAVGAVWAARARRVVEAVCGLAYWAGVPVMLALRYLA